MYFQKNNTWICVCVSPNRALEVAKSMIRKVHLLKIANSENLSTKIRKYLHRSEVREILRQESCIKEKS